MTLGITYDFINDIWKCLSADYTLSRLQGSPVAKIDIIAGRQQTEIFVPKFLISKTLVWNFSHEFSIYIGVLVIVIVQLE